MTNTTVLDPKVYEDAATLIATHGLWRMNHSYEFPDGQVLDLMATSSLRMLSDAPDTHNCECAFTAMSRVHRLLHGGGLTLEDEYGEHLCEVLGLDSEDSSWESIFAWSDSSSLSTVVSGLRLAAAALRG